MIFTEIDSSNEHLSNLAEYINIDYKNTPVVIIDIRSNSKYVLKETPTKENILKFFNDYEDTKAGLEEQVVIEKPL